jgi:hypothetical protein
MLIGVGHYIAVGIIPLCDGIESGWQRQNQHA